MERREAFRDFVYKVQRIDGSLGFMSVSGKPVFDAEGRFSGYRGVASDLTDRKRAEQALQRSESYLAEAQRLSHTGSWGWNVATRDHPLVAGDLSIVRLRLYRRSKHIYSAFTWRIKAGLPKPWKQQSVTGQSSNWFSEPFFPMAQRSTSTK